MPTPMLRNSEVKDILRCEWRWHKAWVEGLTPRGRPAQPLWFGTGIHLALAEWYCGPGKKRGPHPAETWRRYAEHELEYVKTQNATDEQEAVFVDALELGTAMMEGYIELYGRDERKLYIKPETTFKLKIPWPDRQTSVYAWATAKRKWLIKLVGTFDGVYRDAKTGWLWLDEHKTAKAIYLGHLGMDPQAGTYWAVAARALARAGMVKESEELRGIMYNFMRKALPDDRPKDSEGYATNKPTKEDYIAAINAERMKMPNRTGGSWLGPEPTGKESVEMLRQIASKMEITVLGERSKNQPTPLFLRHAVHRTRMQRRSQLLRIQDVGMRKEALVRGIVPITKNPTRDCSWDCQFAALCELHEQGGNWEDFRDLQFKKRDPYADHRKSTDE